MSVLGDLFGEIVVGLGAAGFVGAFQLGGDPLVKRTSGDRSRERPFVCEGSVLQPSLQKLDGVRAQLARFEITDVEDEVFAANGDFDLLPSDGVLLDFAERDEDALEHLADGDWRLGVVSHFGEVFGFQIAQSATGLGEEILDVGEIGGEGGIDGGDGELGAVQCVVEISSLRFERPEIGGYLGDLASELGKTRSFWFRQAVLAAFDFPEFEFDDALVVLDEFLSLGG